MESIVNKIRNGALAQQQLIKASLIDQTAALIEDVKKRGIETIRLMFADQHGILRGKTVTARALLAAFTDGIRVPSTLLLKDVAHRTVFPVWSAQQDSPMHGAGDILLAPQADTFRVLPYAPHSALIHAEVFHTDGGVINFASRTVLAQAVAALDGAGYRATMGLEVEFNLFAVVDKALDHDATRMPAKPMTTQCINQGYQYLTATRYGENEALLDKIRRAAEAMQMPVRSVEIEMGPSQFEFTFDAADPITIADMAVNFRTLAKEVCQREGLFASFMPRPKLPNVAANGWHIHQSVTDTKTGRNIFLPGKNNEMEPIAGYWLAGLLTHAAASCLLTTPTVNGYKRYTAYQLAPNRIGWGEDNRGAMIRRIAATADNGSRLENRVADSSANPYFALASQLYSGLDGIAQQRTPPAALTSPYDSSAALLPCSLIDAIHAFEESSLYRSYLGEEFVTYLSRLKTAEWQRYLMTISEWEQNEYFSYY